jgi:tRNA-2-methylthio-N6-dimethylallyladenosine synthase
MNRADSDRLAAALQLAGHQPAPLAEADLIILNTCSVRASAERRAIGKLNALIGQKRRNPELRIVLMGCMVGVEPPEDLAERFPMVDAFFPPSAVSEVLRTFPGPHQPDLSCLPHMDMAHRPVSAFVPIIYGCDNFCTYCIVPLRRGRERSRPLEDIVSETVCMAESGVREIVLLGQNVDTYGHDLPNRPTLASLLRELDQIENIWRIRFLTSHPKDMNDELIETVARLPRVCPEISLPVQAGHDRLLRRMGRPYTVAAYRRLVERIRDTIPDVALSTDVIVGFPGETEEEYGGTRDLLEELRFDVVHIAVYSPRPGTAAARLPDNVPPVVKKQRRQELEQIYERIAAEKNALFEGDQVEVLVEGLHKGKWRGRTPQGKLCFFQANRDHKGKLAWVRVTRTSAWSLQGQYVESKDSLNDYYGESEGNP